MPGDVIFIEEGDTIPADARLIESAALQTAEAALTGESVPVEKDVRAVCEDAGLADRLDMVFSGTTVVWLSLTVRALAQEPETQVLRAPLSAA